MDNQTIFKTGQIAVKRQELGRLRTEVRALIESLNFIFYRQPLDVEKIELAEVENLTAELVKRLRECGAVADEIRALGGDE